MNFKIIENQQHLDGRMSAEEIVNTQSSRDIDEPLHVKENGKDEAENATLLTKICKLEIENLRMRKSINNYGFNLRDRIKELELEKRELADVIKVMKPTVDVSVFDVSDNSKFVNVDFANVESRDFGCCDGFIIDDHKQKPEEAVGQKDISQVGNSNENGLTDDVPASKKMRRGSQTRHSFLTKGGSFNWDAAIGDNIDDENKRQSTEIALSSMRLSIQKPMMDKSIQQNFLGFYMIGVERSIFSGDKVPTTSRYQPAEILSRFPLENNSFMESIADFAFPLGAYLHLTPSRAYAKSLLQKNPTQYHILQFSDSLGTPSFACCLTVTRAIRLSLKNMNHNRVISRLQPILTRAYARQIIIRFFRRVVRVALGMRQVVVNKDGVVVGYIRNRSMSPSPLPGSPVKSPTPKSPLSFNKIKSSLTDRFGKGNIESIENRRRNSLNLGQSGPTDIALSKGAAKSSSTSDLPGNFGMTRSTPTQDMDLIDSEDVSETSDDDYSVVTEDASHDRRPCPSPKQSRSKAKGASPQVAKPKKRISAKSTEENCYYLISQRAYLLLSAKPLHTFLFKILEEIAQKEEKEMSECDFHSDNENKAADLDNANDPFSVMMTDAHVISRDKFLKYVQCHALEPSAFSYRTVQKKTLYFNFPSYIDHQINIRVNRISMNEWSFAVLFSILSPPLIMYVLNSLILEKSIVLYGSNLSVVSCLTSAILQLLQPFTWEGVFIPIIPANAIEVLEAPVPFIVGTNIPFDKYALSPSANILYVDEILRCHLNADQLNPNEMLKSKYLHRSLETAKKMPISYNLRHSFVGIHNRLCRVLPSCFKGDGEGNVKDRESHILQFQVSHFFSQDVLTPEIRGEIEEVSRCLAHHNTMLTGDINEEGGGWREYGTYDPYTETYNFYPEWFLDHQTSILDFQTELVNTQLFYAYVDRVKLQFTDLEYYRRFIADFVSYQLLFKRKGRN